MAYYAFLDKDNIVVEVISGIDEDELIEGKDPETFYSELRGLKCKRTSYNTSRGEHKEGKEAFRKNFASVGFSYDKQRDAFIPPKPYESWYLDEATCTWDPPVPLPEDGRTTPGQKYFWHEDTQNWVAYDYDEETNTFTKKD